MLSPALNESCPSWEELAVMCLQLVGTVLNYDPAAVIGEGK